MPVTCKNCGAKLSDTLFMVAADGSKHTRCPFCLVMCDIPAKKERPEASEPEVEPRASETEE